jgi:hypothetical protein
LRASALAGQEPGPHPSLDGSDGKDWEEASPWFADRAAFRLSTETRGQNQRDEYRAGLKTCQPHFISSIS